MTWDFSQFHFIRPLWLLAIPALFGLWLLMAKALKTTQWEAYLNKKVLEALRVNSSRQSNLGRWLLLLGWIIGALAAAGPAWQKQPVPSFQNSDALVIVLDLSVSMLSEDLTPNRLTQAKYKLIDILRVRGDGQTALVAYSGDAHAVTPLTDDPVSIEALLPALHPSIMPVKGSNTEAAIELAKQMLKDTGVIQGDILLITDGVTESAQKTILTDLERAYTLSILGVGDPAQASPIPLQGGGFLKSRSGEIILSQLDSQQLNQFARQANGRYSTLRSDDADINTLLNDNFEVDTKQPLLPTSDNTTLYDSWADMGHWLVLLLLPLAALCFRKGILYILPLCLLFPPDSSAFEWQDLWLTPDQQAQTLLEKNPQAAADKFNREDWSAVANYQAENYSAAAEKFARKDDASSHYNRGNALALNGDLESAVEAYQTALELQPDHEGAQHNKQVVAKLLEQQQQNQSGEGQSDDSESANDAEQEQSDSGEQQSSDSGESQTSESQESTDQSEQQSEQESESEQEQQQTAQESAEQADDNSDEKQAHASEPESEQESEEEASAAMMAQATPDQLEDASEQWLRTIQDDPSGLLRRKFEYQSRLKSREQPASQTTNNNSGDERY